MRKKSKQFILFLVVIVSLSLSIVFTDVRTFDTKDISATGYMDSIVYLEMYFGRSVVDICSYRILVPYLARLVPEIPHQLLSLDRSFDDIGMAVIKFGIVNFFFLVGTCIALYFLQLGFGMNYFEAFLGGMLFLGSSTVVRSAGLPIADTAFFFFFTLCVIAIQRNNLLLLLFASIIGVLAKELVVFLSVPLILLSLLSGRRKLEMLLISLISIALYIFVCFTVEVLPLERVVLGHTLKAFKDQLLILISPRGLLRLFFSFGLLWIPAIYALVKCKVPVLLKRWVWLIPIVLLGILLLNGNFDRILFSAFPIAIPLAALGLSRWLDSHSSFSNP
jgi:hypothetical protein